MLRHLALADTPMTPLALALAPRLWMTLLAPVCGQPWKIMQLTNGIAVYVAVAVLRVLQPPKASHISACSVWQNVKAVRWSMAQRSPMSCNRSSGHKSLVSRASVSRWHWPSRHRVAQRQSQER